MLNFPTALLLLRIWYSHMRRCNLGDEAKNVVDRDFIPNCSSELNAADADIIHVFTQSYNESSMPPSVSSSRTWISM